jgi:hypothetical protein
MQSVRPGSRNINDLFGKEPLIVPANRGLAPRPLICCRGVVIGRFWIVNSKPRRVIYAPSTVLSAGLARGSALRAGFWLEDCAGRRVP